MTDRKNMFKIFFETFLIEENILYKYRKAKNRRDIDDINSLGNFIVSSFNFSEQKEGSSFWLEIDRKWQNKLKETFNGNIIYNVRFLKDDKIAYSEPSERFMKNTRSDYIFIDVDFFNCDWSTDIVLNEYISFTLLINHKPLIAFEVIENKREDKDRIINMLGYINAMFETIAKNEKDELKLPRYLENVFSYESLKVLRENILEKREKSNA